MIFDPLLADLQDIITGIIPLVLLAIWVLSQVLGQEKRAERNQMERNRQEIPRAERAGQPAAGGAQQPERSLREEIELFLKQAAAQREQQGSAVEQNRQAEQQREAEADRAKKEKRERRDRKAKQEREAAARETYSGSVEPLDDPVILDSGRSVRTVGTQVRPTVSTRQIQEHVSHLGEAVGQADEKMEERLRSKFEHEVGSLAGSTSTIQDVQPVRALGRAEAPLPALDPAQLREMFRDRSSIRNAIIMKEIIDRPESRWS